MGEPYMTRDLHEGSTEVNPVPVVLVESSLSNPGILQRVMEAEKGEAECILGRLVIIVHAVLLEQGFVVSGIAGLRLPERWAENVAILSVRYTIPKLLVCNEGKDAKPVILKFSLMGNYATAYGYLSKDHPDVHRMCFDLFKLAPLLTSDMNSPSESLEKEVFELWKLVKDGLSLPLLTDICLENGLHLPPCFMFLAPDLKFKVLQSASGVDIANFACTCSEMRHMASDDELWKQKYTEEFSYERNIVLLSERQLVGNSWKVKYAYCWAKQKQDEMLRPLRFPIIRGN